MPQGDPATAPYVAVVLLAISRQTSCCSGTAKKLLHRRPPEGDAVTTAYVVAPLGISRQTRRCSGTVKLAPLHSGSRYYYTAVVELCRAMPSSATGCNQRQLLAARVPHLRTHILVTVGDDDGGRDDVHGDDATSWPEL